MLARALDIVGPYCDLEKRVRDIPPSARARGIWIKNIETVLERKGVLGRYLELFGARAPALAWMPRT